MFMPQTPLQRLQEMQQGLQAIMAALDKGDISEAKRVLHIVGGLMDRALEAERARIALGHLVPRNRLGQDGAPWSGQQSDNQAFSKTEKASARPYRS
jgi:hypothetical protein